MVSQPTVAHSSIALSIAKKFSDMGIKQSCQGRLNSFSEPNKDTTPAK
jgi:hypothetical protein